MPSFRTYTPQKVAQQAACLAHRTVAYEPRMRNVCGSVNAALLMAQLEYQYHYWKSDHRPDGAFYMTAAQIQQQTGLTPAEQQTARRKLRECGFIKETQSKGGAIIFQIEVTALAAAKLHSYREEKAVYAKDMAERFIIFPEEKQPRTPTKKATPSHENSEGCSKFVNNTDKTQIPTHQTQNTTPQHRATSALRAPTPPSVVVVPPITSSELKIPQHLLKRIEQHPRVDYLKPLQDMNNTDAQLVLDAYGAWAQSGSIKNPSSALAFLAQQQRKGAMRTEGAIEFAAKRHPQRVNPSTSIPENRPSMPTEFDGLTPQECLAKMKTIGGSKPYKYLKENRS